MREGFLEGYVGTRSRRSFRRRRAARLERTGRGGKPMALPDASRRSARSVPVPPWGKESFLSDAAARQDPSKLRQGCRARYRPGGAFSGHRRATPWRNGCGSSRIGSERGSRRGVFLA
jgi:hypothetical protein